MASLTTLTSWIPLGEEYARVFPVLPVRRDGEQARYDGEGIVRDTSITFELEQTRAVDLSVRGGSANGNEEAVEYCARIAENTVETCTDASRPVGYHLRPHERKNRQLVVFEETRRPLMLESDQR